jgi:hypothetical protein
MAGGRNMAVRPKKIKAENIKIIEQYSREGLSGNAIQKRLQQQGIRIRRQTMLTIVREAKGQKSQINTRKYTPIKYRHRQTYPSFFSRKGVSAYGTQNGKPKRVQIYGYDKNLQQAAILIAKKAPKKRFLTIDANELLYDPKEYLGGDWDARPQITS